MNTIRKILSWMVANKAIASVVVLALIAGGYLGIKNINSTGSDPTYTLVTVEKGSIISSVSGTGQISSSDQVDIIPEVSGDIVYIGVKTNQNVRSGQVIAKINSDSALRTLKNAELSLANAKIAYQKALKESQNQASDSSISDLKKSYQDGYKVVSNVFIDLPGILSNVNDIFYDPSRSPYFSDAQLRTFDGGDVAYKYKIEAGIVFDKVKAEYEDNFQNYRLASVDSDPVVIIALLDKTYNTVKKLSLALNGTYNTIDYIKGKMVANIPSQIETDKTLLNSYITKINNHTSAITNAQTAIEDAKDSATGADLSLKSAELALSQAEGFLQDAEDNLANHSVKAPFDGVIAKVSLEEGDKASAATSIATLITQKKIAEISLNEVDAAKIKIGQKTTLTFDAVERLTIAGEVSDIDLVGTVSQGVVNYKVQIAFDTDDESIKPGMTVSAGIVTDVKQDILIIPLIAVKSQGDINYVEMFDDTNLNAKETVTTDIVPIKQQVEVGISNDTSSEIISGLKEGDKIILKTVSSVSKTTSTQAPSLLNAATGGGNGGREFRSVTR